MKKNNLYYIKMQQSLPPKFLQPIFSTGKNTVIRREPQVLPVKVEQGQPYIPPPNAYPSSFGSEDYNYGGDYTGGEQYTGQY